MKITFSSKNRTLIVKIIGELDHHASSEIREKIEREINKSNSLNIIFDFSELSFMDSSGIGLVLGRYKNAEKMGGKVYIAGVGNENKRIFEISGLHKIISCFDNLSLAEEAINKWR